MFPRRALIFEVMLLVGVVSALTLAAALLYPTWDDGRLMMAIQGSGSSAIWTNFSNRPLIAVFYTFLFNNQLVLPAGIALHWLAWLGMGLVTMRLWRLLFPAHGQFAVLPALLSVTPILCKIQLVILTIPTIDLLGPVLSFLAIFLLMSEQTLRWRKMVVWVASTALIIFSVLISEYAVVTAAVGFILLVAKAIHCGAERRRARLISALLISSGALFSYALFLWLTRHAGWNAYRPGYVLESFSLRIPFRWLSGIWRGAIGGVLESLGAVTLHSKAALLSFFCGAVVAGLVIQKTYKSKEAEFSFRQDRISVIILLVSLAVGLVPVVLMDRTLESNQDSRFWLPILPVVSCLSVYILFYVLRPRLYFLVPVLCGFLAGYWTTAAITRSLSNPELTVGCGQECTISKPGPEKWKIREKV